MPSAAKSATTVAEYLAALPADRRRVVEAIRNLIRAHVPDGYREGIWWGCIGWSVPLERFPDTYNGQPLGYVAIAANKNYYSLHLTMLYMDPKREAAFRAAFAKAGRKLDMGKGCVRFRSLDDLLFDVIAREVASFPVQAWIARYEQARAGRAKPATATKKATKVTKVTKKAAPRKSAAKKKVARRA